MTPVAPRAWPVPQAAPRLGAVVEAAEAAGASAAAVEALRKDAVALREERRSAGGRLDAARAKAARSAREADDARAALDAAKCRLEASEKAADEAKAELAAVEAELARPSASVPEMPPDIVAGVRALLDALETAPVPCATSVGPLLPERVLAAVRSLRERVDPPALEPQLDEALEAPGKAQGEGIAVPTTAAVPSDGSSAEEADSLMGALDSADEEDDAALVAIARRLKRARQT